MGRTGLKWSVLSQRRGTVGVNLGALTKLKYTVQKDRFAKDAAKVGGPNSLFGVRLLKRLSTFAHRDWSL